MEAPTACSVLKSSENTFNNVEIIPLCLSSAQLLNLQFSALDCNGVTIYSKHPITSSKFVKFNDNIDVLDERLVQRGFVAATIEVERLLFDGPY